MSLQTGDERTNDEGEMSMTDKAKRCAQDCREWYVAFCKMGKGDEKCVKDFLEIADLIETLSAELEQVKRERDAALDDMDNIVMTLDGLACEWCGAKSPDDCGECRTRNEGFVWRGVWRIDDE